MCASRVKNNPKTNVGRVAKKGLSLKGNSLAPSSALPIIKVMSSPQLENGYTSIANEILEVFIQTNLSGQEFRLILFIIRKTYGFRKKEDYISLSQMAKALKTSYMRCSQLVISLQEKNVITVKENIEGKTKKYMFNKNYEKWQPYRKTDIYRKSDKTIKVLRKKPYRKTDSTKETIQKKLLQNKVERFKPPHKIDIMEYTKKQGIIIDIDRFIDFYQSKGWMVGKNKMKDWKAAVRNWARMDRSKSKTGMDEWLEKKTKAKEVIDVKDNTNRFLPNI